MNSKLLILVMIFVFSYSPIAKSVAPVSQPVTSKEDVIWLAKNIYHEARGKSEKLQTAVAIVTINRVRSGKYPNTIKGVVTEKNQFSWYGDKRPDKIRDSVSWRVSKSVATRVLTDNNLPLKRKLKDVLWYHSRTVSPVWAKKKSVVMTVDNHNFYM